MPRDPRAYLQRAEEHRRHGRLKEAIALSIEALGKHPGLDAVRVTLGRAYLENAQPEEARATLLEVFARLPEHHLAGKMLIESQRLLGDLAGAETTCRTLLEHYPRDREIEPVLAEIVRARAAEAPAGPPAPSGPVAATAPPASPAAEKRSGAPAVAVQESDPQPEYFPEDLAAASVTPAPARAVVPPAPRPSAIVQDVAPPAAKPAAPPRPVPAPTIAATPPPAAVAKPDPIALPPIAAVPAAGLSQVPPAPAVEALRAAPVVSAPAAPVASAPAPPVMAAPPTRAAATALPSAAVAPSAPNRPAAPRDALETNTLAELYVKQGLPDRAIDVYRSMLRVEPGNAAARRRLAELEAAAPAAAARSASPEPARRPPAPPSPARAAAGVASAAGIASAPGVASASGVASAPGRSSSPASAPAAATPPAPARALAPADRAAIERLEGWLASVKAGRDRQGGGAAA